MKVVGIITEYNPFHNGHAYQLQKAKELSGADYAVVVMSGNYVQRGTPAILNKFCRTSMALENGADVVFELPVLWATASAESFAAAGIAFLDRLDFVDAVSFGCETNQFELLASIAGLLSEEPEEFSILLTDFLKQGIPFPAAREQAVSSCIMQHPDTFTQDTDMVICQEELLSNIHEILSSPNNILALEYLKALNRRHSSIRPCPVTRAGAGYHDTSLHTDFCSATGIRQMLFSEKNDWRTLEKLLPYVPKNTAEILADQDTVFVSEQDFSGMLYYKLLSQRSRGYADFGDCSSFLSNRIAKLLDSYLDYGKFCELVKTKDVTYTRISRVLLHILLDIYERDYEIGKELDYIPYFRLLGFRKEASFLLKELKNNSHIPLITKAARAASVLPESAADIYQMDVTASNLYYGVLGQKKGQAEKNEYCREIILQ